MSNMNDGVIENGKMSEEEQPWPPEKVNHPKHYNAHPSGVECIEIVRHMGFNLGNVIKYCWRADFKDVAIEDLKKALWYLKDEIEKREGK